MGDDDSIRPPEEWLGFLLSQAAALVREPTYAELRALSLEPRALGLLLALAGANGVGQSMVASRIGVDRTTMSQLVDALVRAKLVVRSADPGDRRNNLLELTPEGATRVREASSRALAVERRVAGHLEAEELVLLKTTLRRLLSKR